MNNLQQKVAVIISRWPWEPGKIPQGWDVQGQLQRQGGQVAIEEVIGALQALAKQHAISVQPGNPPGSTTITGVVADRLHQLIPGN